MAEKRPYNPREWSDIYAAMYSMMNTGSMSDLYFILREIDRQIGFINFADIQDWMDSQGLPFYFLACDVRDYDVDSYQGAYGDEKLPYFVMIVTMANQRDRRSYLASLATTHEENMELLRDKIGLPE